MVAQDPERTSNIVSDLPVSLTLIFKNFYENQETSLVDELSCQLVDTEHVHEAVRVGHAMQSSCVVFGLKQEVQEVDSFVTENSFVAQSCEANQLGKRVCGHFAVQSFIFFAILVEEAAKDADAVKLLVRVARLLDLCEVPDSITSVLNDTVKESEGPFGKLRIAAHLVDNCQKRAEQGHDGFCIISPIKELSLFFVAERFEILDSLTTVAWKLIRRLVTLDGFVLDPIVEHVCSYSWLLVCEDACVHEHLVGDGLAPTFHGSSCLYHLIIAFVLFY